ncbi:MAG: nucleotidyltransferase domain-containing protein [bacterium]
MDRIGFLNTKEQKIVRRFIKELRGKLRDSIIAVKIFGSKVRGDFNKDSDIDIFILIKEKGLRDQVSDIAADFSYEYDISISPVTYSLYEYQENKRIGSLFFEQVEKEGIAL